MCMCVFVYVYTIFVCVCDVIHIYIGIHIPIGINYIIRDNLTLLRWVNCQISIIVVMIYTRIAY